MGDYSRDPTERLTDSTSKHYIAVRMQQGVPLLDAEWNLLYDLRRHEHETLGTMFIGNGVPAGSDGFFIFAVGDANDFGIRMGACIINGKIATNDADIQYTTQPNFGNADLDDPLPSLTTPVSNKQFIVYLDVWQREVDAQEDTALVDDRIGVETTTRVKREWAVRVAGVPEDLLLLDTPPEGHVFYRLATIDREGGNDSITSDMITDLRDTQLSVQRKIEIRDADGDIIVDSSRFQQMVENARNNILSFIRYITTQYNAITAHMTAAEVLGLQAAEHIAATAETGLGLVNSESIGNRGALKFLSQMYDVENNFMVVWRDVVLTLGGTPKKYASYQNFITRLDERLNDQTVGSLTGLLAALDAGNLEEAVAMQEEINRLIGTASGSIPIGSIQVFLAQSPAGNLIQGQIARLQFTVRSFTTLADTYTVAILPEVGWQRLVVDSSGNPIPNNRITVGASGSETTILVDVTVETGSSDLQLLITSDSNPDEITQLTGLYVLTEGQPPPVGEDQVQISIDIVYPPATLDQISGVVTVPRNNDGGINLRVFNYTGQDVIFDLAVVTENAVGTWTINFAATQLTVTSAAGSGTFAGSVTPLSDAVYMQLHVTATVVIQGSTVSGAIIIPFEATI